jgi:hypothetical protein
MKNVFILSLLALTIASCNPQPAHQPADTVPHDTAPADTLSNTPTPVIPVTDPNGICFSYDEKTEHRYMHLWRDGVVVHGELNFGQDGKEGAMGTFEGQIINDTMWITHKFRAEGKVFRREMAYILSGDKLYEGQGMQETTDGISFSFKNKKTLEFPKEPTMVKTECR